MKEIISNQQSRLNAVRGIQTYDEYFLNVT